MPYIKRGDLITVISLLLLSLALLIIPLLSKDKGGRVIAVFEGEEYILSLSEDTEREFSNKKGSITLCINDGEAFVSSSTCPDGVCLKSGRIKNAGESILCAHIGLLVRVDADGDDGHGEEEDDALAG